MHLGDRAARRDERAGVRQTVVGRVNRVPWGKVAPVLSDINLVPECGSAVRLLNSQGEAASITVVVRVESSCLSSSRLSTGRSWLRETDNRLRREELRVDSGASGRERVSGSAAGTGRVGVSGGVCGSGNGDLGQEGQDGGVGESDLHLEKGGGDKMRLLDERM